MTASLSGTRVLVLSDHNGLSRVIELTLTGPMKVVRLVSSTTWQLQNQAEVEDLDLIVVAMSSPSNDPITALSQLSLAGRLKAVPILIISDNPDRQRPANRIIHHLDFPFDIDAFCDKVKEILHGKVKEPSSLTVKVDKTTSLEQERMPSHQIGHVDYGRQAEYWLG
jgi:response regulator RpfG family c-di-GMP phosphodiesterase